jgi:hypothetical protein
MSGISLKLFAGVALSLAAACAPEPVSGPAPEPPTANAGPDQVVRDRDGSGSEPVVLQASGSQPGSHDITAYEWLKDEEEIAGVSNDGNRTLRVELDVGRHLILLKVTNAARLVDTDLVVVDVVPPNPYVTIDSPRDGVAFATGSEVQFAGSGEDQYERPIAEQRLSWTSDLDGLLGTGELLVLDGLSRGTHAITLTATDRDGFVGHASVEIRVEHPPTVAILSPADGTAFAWLDEVQLVGSCTSQDEAGVRPWGLNWYSDGGALPGYGPEVTVEVLNRGTHEITLRCTDSLGLWTDATVTIAVFVSYEAHIATGFDNFGCTMCHFGETPRGGVRLDSHQAITTGGTAGGPLIVPGDATQGILIPQMTPPHHAPSDLPWGGWASLWCRLIARELCMGGYNSIEVIQWWVQDILAEWIEDGAPDN